ncbi:MAG: tetratricopeptide repeat protein [Candidatus Sulfotelmatobacter sp.]
MRTAGFASRLNPMPPPLLSAVFLVLLLVSVGGATPSPMELLTSGHVDELVQDLQHQIAHSPNDAAAENLLCRAYFMMEEWDRGIAACERAINLDPQNSSYYLWLGRSYGEKADRSGFLSAPGLAKKSRAAFERAVELDPKNVEAHVDLGEFYAEAPGIIGGGRDKAYRQADELMPLNPAMAHWVLARIAEKEKDPAKAEAEYRAEIATSRSGVRGWVDLANFFMYARRYQEMEEALQHAEAAPIDHPESLMNAGNLLLRAQRDYSLGIRLVRRYLANRLCEEGPAFKAHAILGELLEKAGDRAGAAQEFHAALALFQEYPRAKEDLKQLGRS